MFGNLKASTEHCPHFHPHKPRLWGAGGRGGAPVRLVPEGGCAPAERRLRHRGGYRGTGTRADLNNHANQMHLA